MQKKKLIGAGIGVVVVIAVICGGIVLHKDSETIETIAEVTPPIIEEDSPKATEKPETVETEPPAEETTDAEETGESTVEMEQETDVLQEDERETETAEEETIDDLDTIMYATTNVNLRKGTAVTTESLRLVGYAEEVKVTGITTNKQWYRVEDTEKGEGFIASSYLSDTKPQQNTSSQQASSGSSESTQSSSDGVSTSQSGGGSTSSQQAEIERMKAELSGLGTYTGSNMEMDWGGSNGQLSGGHHLNQ